jgi:DNA-binding transcriptional LysR family regulator
VQEVERRLGTTLLDRSKRPIELTDAGRIYRDFCRDVLHRQEEFSRQLESLKGDLGGTVRVASIYSTGISEMSRLRDEFAARYPAANLQVEYMRPDKVYEAVRNDAADLGLVSYPESSREIAALDWRREEMQVAAPVTHPLAARAELFPSDLNGQDFVAFDDDLRIRKELDKFLRAHGVEVNVTMHFDNVQMIKEAVEVGPGISILPVRTMQAEVEQGRLAAVKLNAPELARRAEAAGVQLISVHGRTRCQFYKGEADWGAVRAVKDAIGIPLVVNGDITSFEKAVIALEMSGADAVMVGRGAQGQPWLPGQIGRRLETGIVESVPSLAEQLKYIRTLYDEVCAHYGLRIGLRHARKHLGWALESAAKCSCAPVLTLKTWRQKVLTSDDPRGVHRSLQDAFDDFAWSAAA